MTTGERSAQGAATGCVTTLNRAGATEHLDDPTGTDLLLSQMCADSGHADIVDVHVALCARERDHAVVTSDPDHLARIDPGLALIRV